MRGVLGIVAALCLTAAPAAAETLWEGFASPVGMAFDAAGNLYVAEWSAGRVSRVSPDGARTVAAEVPSPSGLAIAPDGAVHVASYGGDAVYRFLPGGRAEVRVRGLGTPAGLAFDRAGRLLIANRRSNEIFAIGADGIAVPLLGGFATPVGVVETADGGHVVAEIAGGVKVIRPDGRRIEAGEGFAAPGAGVAQTRDGRVFAVDYGGTTVREIGRDGGNRVVAEGLRSPVGLAVAPDGASLLVGTWGDGAIHRIAIPAP